jgi:hypothetical protein
MDEPSRYSHRKHQSATWKECGDVKSIFLILMNRTTCRGGGVMAMNSRRICRLMPSVSPKAVTRERSNGDGGLLTAVSAKIVL